MKFSFEGEKVEAKNDQSKEVGFVTKKALITFMHPICIMLGEMPVFISSAICEFEDEGARRLSNAPSQLVIVALPDGRLLKKSLRLRLSYSAITAMVEMDQEP